MGVLDIEEIRDKDNATGLNKGRGIEMSIYSAFPYTRCSLSFAFVLPGKIFKIKNILTNFYLTCSNHLSYKCWHFFVVGSDFSCTDRQWIAVVEIGEFAAVTVVCHCFRTEIHITKTNLGYIPTNGIKKSKKSKKIRKK